MAVVAGRGPVSSTVLVDELRLRRFARLAAPLLRGKATQGIGPRAARNRAGTGLEFLDLRRYTPGEDVRHVDWRAECRQSVQRPLAASMVGPCPKQRCGKWSDQFSFAPRVYR